MQYYESCTSARTFVRVMQMSTTNNLYTGCSGTKCLRLLGLGENDICMEKVNEGMNKT